MQRRSQWRYRRRVWWWQEEFSRLCFHSHGRPQLPYVLRQSLAVGLCQSMRRGFEMALDMFRSNPDRTVSTNDHVILVQVLEVFHGLVAQCFVSYALALHDTPKGLNLVARQIYVYSSTHKRLCCLCSKYSGVSQQVIMSKTPLRLAYNLKKSDIFTVHCLSIIL